MATGNVRRFMALPFIISTLLMLGIAVYLSGMVQSITGAALQSLDERLLASARNVARQVSGEELGVIRTPGDKPSLLSMDIKRRLLGAVKEHNLRYACYVSLEAAGATRLLVDSDPGGGELDRRMEQYLDQAELGAVQEGAPLMLHPRPGSGMRSLFMALAPVFDQSGRVRGVAVVESYEVDMRYVRDRIFMLGLVFFLTAIVVALSAVIGFIFYQRQIEELRESDERVKTLLNSTPMACSFRSWPEGDFLECNEEALKMFGVPGRAELLGHFYDFVPEFQPDGRPSRAVMREHIDNTMRTGGQRFEWTFVTAKGEYLPVETTMLRVPWRNEHRIASYSRDMRKTKASERKMREAYERNRQLEVETRAAQVASKAKSDFLATMSHEIRTPLNAIIGLSEVEMQSTLPAATHENLEKIYNSGSILLGIVNDILDISKIESGNFELIPTRYDVPSMINDVVQLNVLRIGHKNIAFKLSVDESLPSVLNGDELRVKQILNNLLSNAFKYTDEGEVRLDIGWEQEDNSVWLNFTVSDTGHGIKKTDMPKLFSSYSQLDSKVNRRIEGTGLGLAITKNLVELMGGTIMVQSEYRVGSTFKARVRQNAASDAAKLGKEAAETLRSLRFTEHRASRAKNLARAYMPYGRVLVVDDVPTNLDVVKGLLTPYGLAVDCVSSGQEAINRVRDRKVTYDVIFMDHMMPYMDGVEATRVIREAIGTDYARTVPIIALTANALAGNKEMFLANGFNGFIPKPIDVARLDACLNKFIRDKQSEETLLKAMQAKEEKDISERRLAASSAQLEGRRVEGLDIAAGVQRYGSENIYMDVLRSYLTHTPALLDKLRALSESGLRDYIVNAHGLKGSSYGICASAVGRMAEDQEFTAKAGDYSAVLEGNKKLLEETERLLFSIKEVVESAVADGGEKPRRASPDKTALAQLLEACVRFRLPDMEAALAELEGCAYESGGELIVWLREQTDNLEYDAIRSRLEEFLSGGPAKGAAASAERRADQCAT